MLSNLLPPFSYPVRIMILLWRITLFLADDGSKPPGIESDDDDSVDDDTSISLPEFESFYVDYPNSGNSTIDVVEDIPVMCLSGYQQKDRKPSQNDKTEHGMEKTVQNQGQSPKMPKSESILKNQQSNRSRN
ncbi:hypothetical protein Tco_0370187 [Tanacetum coccineum]